MNLILNIGKNILIEMIKNKIEKKIMSIRKKLLNFEDIFENQTKKRTQTDNNEFNYFYKKFLNLKNEGDDLKEQGKIEDTKRKYKIAYKFANKIKNLEDIWVNGKKKHLKSKIIIMIIITFLIALYESFILTWRIGIKAFLFYGLVIPAIVILEFIIVIILISSSYKEILDLYEFRGTGTKTNPIIIDSKEKIPQTFKISKSKLQVHFLNCEIASLILYKVKNCNLESCRFILLDLDSCSDIKIINSFIDDELILENCQKVKIEYSSINMISLYSSSSNIIKNCRIKEIDNEYSFGNILKKNEVLKEELVKLTKTPASKKKSIKNLLKKNLLELFLFLTAIYCALFISFYTLDDLILIIISTILLFFILFSIVFLFIFLSPNKIKNVKLRRRKRAITKYSSNK